MSGTERASGGGAITLRLCYAMAGTEPAYVFAPGKQQHYIPENLLGNHTAAPSARDHAASTRDYSPSARDPPAASRKVSLPRLGASRYAYPPLFPNVGTHTALVCVYRYAYAPPDARTAVRCVRRTRVCLACVFRALHPRCAYCAYSCAHAAPMHV
eukprot:3862945-Rhodomonas_salina.7